jgi:hypothetical protein
LPCSKTQNGGDKNFYFQFKISKLTIFQKRKIYCTFWLKIQLLTNNFFSNITKWWKNQKRWKFKMAPKFKKNIQTFKSFKTGIFIFEYFLLFAPFFYCLAKIAFWIYSPFWRNKRVDIWPKIKTKTVRSLIFKNLKPYLIFTGDFDLPKRICLNGLFWLSFDKGRLFFIKIFNFGDVTKCFLHFLMHRNVVFTNFVLYILLSNWNSNLVFNFWKNLCFWIS